MVFRTFDRMLFARAEATPGTAASIATSTDYFETIDPQFTVTPMMFERLTKSQSLTTQQFIVPGTAKATPSASCEISFGVELAGPGTSVSSGTAPKIETLLLACGLVKTNAFKYGVNAAYTGGPFFHLENVEGNAGVYASADAQSLSCNAYGDTEFWAKTGAGTLGNVAIKSAHSGATVTATGTAATQFGVAYYPSTAQTAPDLANSAVTLRLYISGNAGSTNSYVEAKGCKGTFDIAFTHGDRAVINFTFTGVLANYTDGAALPADHSYTAEVPPAFVNSSLELGTDTAAVAYWDGALFNSMAFALGNEVALREDTNAVSGYANAVISNRSPTLNFNPDAVTASGNYDFWDAFLAGNPIRMRWSVGTTAGNRVDFRMTSAQFSGISDGNRDSVTVTDSTTNLTGGQFGSTIITSGGSPSGSTFGSDNEFVICFR